MRWMGSDPVGLPGLAVLAAAMLGFALLMLLARRRRGAGEQERARLGGSWGGVVIQAAGIACAGSGPIVVALDPLSPQALLEAGAVALLAGATLWLFLAASRAMGRNWAIVARTRDDHELVTTGPFARVRHPIYTALFLLMLAIAIACGHWRSLAIAVPLYALGTWLRVAREERLLRAQFGAAYDRYAARVTRFVPGLF